MSVSGLKAELKFLASIFDKNHERFRIVSWKLDELHCQFLVPPPPPPPPPPGSSLSPPPPPPPLTLHCNITVRRPVVAPRGRAGADRAPQSRDKGRLPGRPPESRARPVGGWALGPAGSSGCLVGRRWRRVAARPGPALLCWPLAAPVGPRGRHGRPQPACSGDRGLSVGSCQPLRWKGSQVSVLATFFHQVSKPPSLLVQPVLVCVLVSEDKRTLKAYVFKEKV